MAVCRSALTVPLAVLAAVGVAGCGSSANEASAPPRPYLVSLPGGDAARFFLRAPSPVEAVLPVTGGRVAADTLRGRIDLAGRLALAGGPVGALTVDSTTGTVTGTVDGARRVVLRFDPRALTWEPPDSGVVRTWDVPLTRDGRAAGTMDLRVSVAGPAPP